jgi:hypothetical protein
MTIRSSTLILAIASIFPIGVQADAKPKKRRIAILPITSTNPRDADAQFAGELIRTELISSGVFEVVANDQVESQLKIIEKKQKIGAGSCSSKECVIDVGNALESELIFAGKLIKSSNGAILISGRVINVVSQKEEYSASETSPSNDQLEKICKTLVVKLNLWVTDASFMREMSNQEKEREKAKMLDQSGKNAAQPPAPSDRKTYVRTGLGTVAFTGETLKTYYTTPLAVSLDIFLYHHKALLNRWSLFIRGEWRSYSTSTGANYLSALGPITYLSGGLIVRKGFFGFKSDFGEFQPYVMAGLKYNYLNQGVYWQDPNHKFSGLGAIAGVGVELGFSLFGLFAELGYGYSPIGNAKENVDGLLFNGGVALRF